MATLKCRWGWVFPRLSGVVVLVVIIWFAVGYLSAQRACAHDPRFVCSPRTAEDPVRIAGPTKSWAFYGHLERGQTDAYVFSLDRAAKIPLALLVDERDTTSPARPVAAVSSADGALLQSMQLSRIERFYEPFSRERYITTPTAMLSLKPGRYRIAVSMRGGSALQRYTLAIGTEERFGISELPYVFGAIHRIRSLQY